MNDRNQQIKQLQESLDKYYILRMAVLADVIDRFVDIKLKGSVSWLKLYAITMLVLSGGSSTPSKLGRIILRPKESITKLVNLLEKEGLMRRYQDENDRRNVQIILTDKGIDYVNRMLMDIEKTEKELETSIDPTLLKVFCDIIVPLSTWLIDSTQKKSSVLAQRKTKH
jgi:DNA-binding MarR family transcriptional regulator